MTRLTLYLFLFCSFFIAKAQHTLVLQKGASLKLEEGTLLYIQGNLVADTIGTGVTRISVENNANLVLGDAKNKKSDWLNLQETTMYIDGKGTVWLAASYGQNIEGKNDKNFSTSFNNITMSDAYPSDGKNHTQKQILGKNNDIEVRGTLDINDEYVKTFSNDLWITNPDTNAILRKKPLVNPSNRAFEEGMISSDSLGRLVRATNSMAHYCFPTGQFSNNTVKGFHPVLLKPRGSTLNFYGVRTVVADPSLMIGKKKDVTIDNVTKMFYEQINHLAGSEEADIQLYYDNTFDLNGTAQTTNTLAQWDNQKGWSNMGTVKNGQLATSTNMGFHKSEDNIRQIALSENSPTENITIANINNRYPRAEFDTDVKKGCLPLSVKFKNQSIYAKAVVWKFPGGKPATSNEWEPTVIYDKPGTYSVEMYVKNDIGQDSLAKSDFITVKAPPIASFNYANIKNDVLQLTNLSSNYSYIQWIVNGKGIKVSKDTFAYEIPQTGTQKIKLIAHNECGTSEDYKEFYKNIQITCNEIDMNFEPNPADQFTNLKLNGESTAALPYRFFTIDGRLVWEGKLPANTKYIEFDLRNLPSAMYILVVECEQSVITKKILKAGNY